MTSEHTDQSHESAETHEKPIGTDSISFSFVDVTDNTALSYFQQLYSLTRLAKDI